MEVNPDKLVILVVVVGAVCYLFGTFVGFRYGRAAAAMADKGE